MKGQLLASSSALEIPEDSPFGDQMALAGDVMRGGFRGGRLQGIHAEAGGIRGGRRGIGRHMRTSSALGALITDRWASGVQGTSRTMAARMNFV